MELKIFKGYERFEGSYPVEAVQYALSHKEEAIPELLEILEYTLQNVKNLAGDDQYLIHFPAIYMLAFFQESQAYDNLIRLGRLPDFFLFALMGDAITGDYGKILGSVCSGNIEPIKDMIEDASMDEYVRTQAMQALMVLLKRGTVSRGQLVAYFKELFNGKLMADDSYVWELLPYCCSLIQPCEIMEELKQAVADGRIMSALFDNEFFESRQSMTVEEAFEDLGHYSSFQMITEEDVLELESWVGSTSSDEDEDDDDEDDDGEDDDEDEDDDDDEDNEDDDEDGDEDDDGFDEDAERADYMDYEPQAPVMRLDFTGRNQPCPCGSGKKYKKCCLGK